MFGDEIQNRAIENLRLLPVSRVACFRDDHRFGVLDPSREEPQNGRRSVHVRPAREQECRCPDGFEQSEGEASFSAAVRAQADQPGG